MKVIKTKKDEENSNSILILDSNRLCWKQIYYVLNKLHFRIVIAETRAEAQKKIINQEVNKILLDISKGSQISGLLLFEKYHPPPYLEPLFVTTAFWPRIEDLKFNVTERTGYLGEIFGDNYKLKDIKMIIDGCLPMNGNHLK